MNDNANDPGCHDCGNAPTYGANGDGQRLCATDAAHAQSIGWVIAWDEDAPQDAKQTPVATARPTQCAYCHVTGPAALFEVIGRTGSRSFACKATTACQIRQSGESPAHVLSALLRAVRAELPIMTTVTTGELAALVVDLDGFGEAVRAHLAWRKDGRAALESERADRKARKAKRS